MKRSLILALALMLAQTSCIMIGGGYSNRGGWFFWPGGLGFVLLVVVLFLLWSRRGRGR